MREFVGRTADAEAPFLSGGWWTQGQIVRGKVVRVWQDKENRTNYTLDVACELKVTEKGKEISLPNTTVEIEGEEQDRVSIGNLAGIKMAMQSARLERFPVNTILELECEDIQPPKKEGHSPRPNFRMHIWIP